MRVLISRLSALGDVVCTLPVAGAIKSQWPKSEVFWVVDKRFRAIVDRCRHVDNVIERPEKPWISRTWGAFDAALDMQGLMKSGVLVGFANAKRKLGYHWQREGSWLFSQSVTPDDSSLHVVDQYVDVARALGANTETADFGLAPREEDLESVESKLRSHGLNGSPFVACNAGAGWVSKRWNPRKVAELCEKCHLDGFPFVFLGSKADRPVLDEVRDMGAKNTIDLVGETNIGELVALISRSVAHFGGDTGSTHIAAALNVPAIGVYTLTRPERSCPYGQIANVFEGDPEVDTVYQKLRETLATRP